MVAGLSASLQQTPEISQAVGQGVSQVLGVPVSPAAAGYRPEGNAYALYLKGRALFRERSNTSMEAARGLMLQAIAIDPKFAGSWAYAGGVTLLQQKNFRLDGSWASSPPITPVQSLKHALELPTHSPTRMVSWAGWINLIRLRPPGTFNERFSSVRTIRRSLYLVDPGITAARQLCGICEGCVPRRRARSALAQIGRGSCSGEPVGG